MNGYILNKNAVEDSDMEKINKFTRRQFKKEEVYIFSLVLCDNEVDRDFDKFSVCALEQLKELFVGKTCIFDHERKSANQTARIFHTETKTENRKTESKEIYTALIARAYLPRTEKTKDMITAIESGILKEVSVSCAVEKSRCSLCGKEVCGHKKGQSYLGKLCYKIFDSVSDAYECSFVAVPAQRAAGVTKHFKAGEVKNVHEVLKSLHENKEVFVSEKEAEKLSCYIKELEEKSFWGEEYRNELCRDIMRFSAISQPEMPREVIKAAVKNLDVNELKSMANVYEKMAEKQMPIRPQLRSDNKKELKTNDEFRI